MNRRKFLGALTAAAAAAGLAATASAPSDDFMYRGFRVMWRGWREPVNQNVSIGLWWAFNERTKKCCAGTTLGRANSVGEMDVVDCSREKGWPLITASSTAQERADAKERGRQNLLRLIDASEAVA